MKKNHIKYDLNQPTVLIELKNKYINIRYSLIAVAVVIVVASAYIGSSAFN